MAADLSLSSLSGMNYFEILYKGILLKWTEKIAASAREKEDGVVREQVHLFLSRWPFFVSLQQWQNLMTSQWITAQQKLPQDLVGETSGGKDECSPLFRLETQVFGCEHYKRNCKLRAACCGKLFTCRFCHDKVITPWIGKQPKKMCLLCLEIQPVRLICTTPCNGLPMAKYYCGICKFFDDERDLYHCPFCNLCCVGKGLRVDYFHCMTCNCCLGMMLTSYKCLEKGLETNCPICCDFLFTSSATVRTLPCGHYMHSACFQVCKEGPFGQNK